MHSLVGAMANRIASGLQRKAVTKPSKWACTYRMMGEPFSGPWSFKHHPWLKEMHDAEEEFLVGQKSAQMGYTEWALNLTFFHIDVKNVDCLYVLPAKSPDASDFSAGRFDRALELSDHLSDLFSDVRNVGHKRAGSANLYIRGSRSRSSLKSIPVGFIVIDELDEMDKENVPLALERKSGQVEWKVLLLSTPTLPDVGINEHFSESSQDHFMFKCPACSRRTELIFPECLKIIGEDSRDPRVEESHLICKECEAKLAHELKPEFLGTGAWVPSFDNRVKRGFYINQLYSSARACRPSEIARSYFKSLYDPASETELYNSKLGLAHAVTGAQIDDSDINSKIESYKNGMLKPTGLITMGVDVGNRYLHYEIDQWRLNGSFGTDFNTDAYCRVLCVGKVQQFEELDLLMRTWGPQACVVDAQPDRRHALQFANRFYGFVRLCIYGQGINGKDVHPSKDEEHMVFVDRTSWLDLSLGRFKRPEVISLPADLPIEYREQLKVLTRVYRKDKLGNPTGYYENFDKDDHYAHARNYSEIALKFAATIKKHTNIRSPL